MVYSLKINQEYLWTIFVSILLDRVSMFLYAEHVNVIIHIINNSYLLTISYARTVYKQTYIPSSTHTYTTRTHHVHCIPSRTLTNTCEHI